MPPKETDNQQERFMFLRVKDIDAQNPNLIYVVVSTDEVDRYGEIILPSAFRDSMASFIANPVVLGGHTHKYTTGEPPVIGNIVTDGIKFEEHIVVMPLLFDEDELSQKWAGKYRRKVMRAFSVGFIGLEYERQEIDGRSVHVWTKIELLEVSAVAVPANRTALARVAGFYGRQVDDDDRIVQAVKAAMADELDALRDGLDEIKSLLIPDSDEFAEELLLGDSPDPLDPAGAELSGQIDRIKTVCKEFSNGCDAS